MITIKPNFEYKNINLIDVEKIPKHWEVQKMRFIGKFTSSGIDKKIIEGEPMVKIINYTDVYGNENRILNDDRTYMEVSCSKDKAKEHQVQIGDLIFTPSSETIEDIGLSALVDTDLDNTAYSYHVLRFRFERDVDHNFKKYLCNNYIVLNQFSSLAKGTTRQILNREHFNNTVVILPPIEEQTAIANFLDDKTAQIDKLISNKQKLIELLKEERTAIINEAVNGEGKNWERKKLKYVAKLKSGKGITSDNIKPEGDFPVYGGNGLRGYTSTFTHNGKYVLIGRQGALCGNINYANGKFFASEHAVVVSILIENEFVWLGELLRSMNLNQYSQASAQPGLSVEKIQNLLIPVPNEKEKDFIVQHIQSENQRIDKTISIIEKEIELMQEYRTALISEAVTGKLKITN